MSDQPPSPIPPPPPAKSLPAPRAVPPPPPASSLPAGSAAGPAAPSSTLLAIGAAAAATAVMAGLLYALMASTGRFFAYAFLAAGGIVAWAAKKVYGRALPVSTAVVVGAVTLLGMLVAAFFLARRDDDTLGELFERNPIAGVMMLGAGVVAGFFARRD